MNLVDALLQGLGGKSPRRFQALAVVRRAPGGRVDVDEVRPIAQGLSLHSIVHDPVEHLDATDFGLKRHAYAALAVVRLHGYFSGAPGPVSVCFREISYFSQYR